MGYDYMTGREGYGVREDDQDGQGNLDKSKGVKSACSNQERVEMGWEHPPRTIPCGMLLPSFRSCRVTHADCAFLICDLQHEECCEHDRSDKQRPRGRRGELCHCSTSLIVCTMQYIRYSVAVQCKYTKRTMQPPAGRTSAESEAVQEWRTSRRAQRQASHQRGHTKFSRQTSVQDLDQQRPDVN